MPILSIPILAFVALTVLAIFKFIIHPTLLSPLSKVPNAHWSAPISPLWILWIRYKSRENRTLHAAHLKLGPVIRVAPNELSVNDLGSLRTVYSGGFEKGEWYSIFDNYGVPCMFSAWYSNMHSVRKRMISHIYSKSTIHSSIALSRQAQVILYDRLLPLLSSISSPQSQTQDKGVNVHEIWNATTMDFITAYLFGTTNGSSFLTEPTYRKHWLSLYHNRKTYTFFPQELPSLTALFKRIRLPLVPTWVDAANAELEAWTQDRCTATSTYVEESMTTKDADPGNEPVVFNAMLAGIAKERRTKASASVLANETLKYPDLSIASEMIDHLAAGHETSGITLTYLSWELSQNVALQDALRTELLGLSPNMLYSANGPQNIPSSKDLDALPLLHAVLMETLRLYAAIPGGQPRMTPSSGCVLGAHSIPGGVRVAAQAHSVHRNEAVYPLPEKFDYTRWLDSVNGYTEEQRRERDRWFWAFSSGGRMCIGSNFAMHEIKLVVAAVYSNFRTSIVDDEGVEQTDGYTCGPVANQLWLKFERLV